MKQWKAQQKEHTSLNRRKKGLTIENNTDNDNQQHIKREKMGKIKRKKERNVIKKGGKK